MNSINDKVTIVIRSVGERTEQLCRQLILAQGVSPANVVTIRESPFSAALRRSFEIGIDCGRPWTYCVDADVLLGPGSIVRMVQLAEEQEENVCEMQGFILDKFFGGPREAGNHLYRTSLLPVALDSIPSEEENTRPESDTLRAMQVRGFPFVRVKQVVGLHDHEQYYRDIFRKCFVHAHKHLYRAEPLVSLWRDRAIHDEDYVVALHGFAQGITHLGNAPIDADSEIYQGQLRGLGIQEKGHLPDSSYTLSSIEEICENWVEPDIYRRFFPTKMGFMDNESERNSNPRISERFKRVVNEIGLARSIPLACGSLLIRLGAQLRRWVRYPEDE